jgi:hypothetical protein
MHSLHKHTQNILMVCTSCHWVTLRIQFSFTTSHYATNRQLEQPAHHSVQCLVCHFRNKIHITNLTISHYVLPSKDCLSHNPKSDIVSTTLMLYSVILHMREIKEVEKFLQCAVFLVRTVIGIFHVYNQFTKLTSRLKHMYKYECL